MDPRDRPRLLPDGARCTACGATVPAGRIRVLAEREDLVFVELDCDACGSTALGLLESTSDGRPRLDVAAEGPAAGPDPSRSGQLVSLADVEAIRRDLATWNGDLVRWLAAIDPGRVDAGGEP